MNMAMVKEPPWLELEDGIWENILKRLSVLEILKIAREVCRKWRQICKEPSMWRVIDMRSSWDLIDGVEMCCGAVDRSGGELVERNLDDFARFIDMVRSWDLKEGVKMCRRAIHRSRGELVEINLLNFATNKLLRRIAARSGKLKRLSIACCYFKVCKGLVETVQKFPLLEELSLTHTAITIEGIKALGRSCPRLKSFEFNKYLYMDYDEDDNEDEINEEALAIAKHLPTLHHLHLIGNSMTNKGLQAILDGCPHLVSLDLRLCIYVSLNEVLSSRISWKIKDVKLPQDSLEGLEFSFEASEDEYSSDDY